MGVAKSCRLRRREKISLVLREGRVMRLAGGCWRKKYQPVKTRPRKRRRVRRRLASIARVDMSKE